MKITTGAAMALTLSTLVAGVAEARPHGFHGHRGHGFRGHPHCRTFYDHGHRRRVCQ